MRTFERPLPTRLDVRRILAECASDVLLHTVAIVMTYTGIRPGELTALTIRDYDPAARTLAIGTVRHPRTITIARSAAAALAISLKGETTEPDEPLLMGLRRQWMYPLLQDAAKRAGVDIGVHDLRRAAMAAVVEAGRPVSEVQAYFGISAALDPNALTVLPAGWDAGVADVLEAAFAAPAPSGPGSSR